MAVFEGSEPEFNRYVGPRVRNVVQLMTKSAKRAAGGACAHCGRTGVELEAAHVHGRERTAIIHELLERYRAGETYRVDLGSFERRLRAAHEPIEKTFLFLCPDCHRAYDREGRTSSEDGRPSRPAAGPVKLPAAAPGDLGLAPGESNKAYVSRVFSRLYDSGRIPESELRRLSERSRMAEEYRLRTFGFSRPLFVRSDEERFDENSHPRYYADSVCDGIHLCSQWYFTGTNASYNLDKFQAWARRMLSSPGEAAPESC